MCRNLDKILPLNNKDIYVVADFDRTFTVGNSKTSWSLLASTDLLPKEYIEDRQVLFDKYRPIEIDTTMPFEYRLEQTKIWFKLHAELFVKYKLKESFIQEIVRNRDIMTFRDGAKDFLKYLYENDIPLIIISAGIGNFIKEFLEKEECYYSNIYISSNMLNFEEGIAIGVENNIIHSLNKNEVSLPNNIKKRLENRTKVILLGDQIDDIRMVSKDKRNNTIRIGFLIDKDSRETYEKHFDIVCEDTISYDEIGKKLFENYK